MVQAGDSVNLIFYYHVKLQFVLKVQTDKLVIPKKRKNHLAITEMYFVLTYLIC